MPPPLGEVSDDESTGGSIPYNDAEETQEVKADETKAGASGDEEDDDDDEGVYVVEKIMGHEFHKNGSLLLQVKWKGYDDPADQTMEPEENLMEGAKELVEDYYKQQGGRPEKQQKRKRKSTGPKPKSEPTETKKRLKSETPAKADSVLESTPDTANNTPALTETSIQEDEAPWMPKGSWEKALVCVETIVRDPESQSLIAYLHWRNGKKTKTAVTRCYDKCPRKMLEFYEKHLVFKEG